MIVGSLVAALSINSAFSYIISTLYFGSLVIGGILTASFATSKKFVLALMLSIPFTGVAVLINTIHYFLGFATDTPGIDGAMIVSMFFLPVGLLLSAIGGGIGWVATRRIGP